ncbi:MAG: MFS transporter [Phenylobacterium sp.]|nr:MFS transporter [Phenylobacterium sp.]
MTSEAAHGRPGAPSASTGALSRRTKLFFGLGEAGEGVKTAALETFLFFYYVQVVGLSGALTGLALFVALLFDGVSDPLVGAWSDRTRSRLGRRHPFLYAAPVPLAIALWFLFRPPELAQVELFLWLTGFTIAARFAMTLYFVPHMALGAELSQDFHERVAIGGYRVLFGYLGRIVALGLAFSVFFADRPGFANGQLDASAYPPFALTAGLLVVVFVIGSALGTQRAALGLGGGRPAPAPPPRRGLVRTLGQAMRSPSFRALFLALLVMYLYNGVQFALALHMNTYFWQLPPAQVQMVFYASMVGYILGIPLARPAASRLDKKAAYMMGIAGSCIVGSSPTLLRLLGLAPENGEPGLLPLLLGASFLAGFIGCIPVVLSSAMLADVADEFDFLHHGRAEGLFFGANAFCRKASLGLGGAVAGLVIDLIRFPAKVDPAAAPADAVLRLGVTYGPIMLAVLFAGLAIMIPYRLDRTRHAAMASALAQRER